MCVEELRKGEFWLLLLRELLCNLVWGRGNIEIININKNVYSAKILLSKNCERKYKYLKKLIHDVVHSALLSVIEFKATF